MLYFFGINPNNHYYQQCRKNDNNDKEQICSLHKMTGSAVFLKAKLAAYQGEILILRLTKA